MTEWDYGNEAADRAEYRIGGIESAVERAETSDGVFLYDSGMDGAELEGEDSSDTPVSWKSALERVGDDKHPMRQG